MNRRPSALRSTPPSPRTPSVTRIPRTDGGHTMPVGWNCTNSMSIRSAPAHSASAWPSPVYSQELEVIFQALPIPPVADVRQPGVAVPAEVALEDAAVGGAVEQRAPLLELQHPVGCLLRVELGHAPVVEHLAAAHGVAEVDAPVVLRVDVAQRRGHAALRHDRVGLAEQGLADDRRPGAAGRRLDRGPQAGPAGADDDDVVLVDLLFGHLKQPISGIGE